MTKEPIFETTAEVSRLTVREASLSGEAGADLRVMVTLSITSSIVLVSL